jgi:hypothetical protein
MTLTTPSLLPRPSVQDVANLLRARTKDSNGLEVGTFDTDTRPTADQVEQLIEQSAALVAMQLPLALAIPAEYGPSVAMVIALECACRVEKSYWPEQVQQQRSPYALLRTEYDEAILALRTSLESGGPAGFARDEVLSLPIGSWTSMPGSFIGAEPTAPVEPVRGPLPATVDLTIYHGDTWAQTFRLLDASGQPHDLTGAQIAAATSGGVNFSITVGPDPGVITLRLPPTGHPVGNYRYDVEVTEAATVTTWITGALDVVQDVTP